MTRAIAYFGTYEAAYPRTAVVLRGLYEKGISVYELNAPLPPLTAAEIASAAGVARMVHGLASAYGRLARGALRRPPAVEAIVAGYPGHLIMPLARQMASCWRVPLVFDPLVSLWDTFVGDRGLVSGTSLPGRAVRLVDRASFALADLVLADTAAHADYFSDEFGVPRDRLAVMPVGALPVAGVDATPRQLAEDEPLTVFQYGKWSPLHGADCVIAAADLLRGEPFRFVLVGEGQCSDALRAQIKSLRLTNVEWLGRQTPADLRRLTLSSDVCLGVFGRSEKAARVIPNKVFDALSCGRPLVTADTVGAREGLTNGRDALLVPAGDAAALAAALRSLRPAAERRRLASAALALYRRAYSPPAVAEALLAALAARASGRR